MLLLLQFSFATYNCNFVSFSVFKWFIWQLNCVSIYFVAVAVVVYVINVRWCSWSSAGCSCHKKIQKKKWLVYPHNFRMLIGQSHCCGKTQGKMNHLDTLNIEMSDTDGCADYIAPYIRNVCNICRCDHCFHFPFGCCQWQCREMWNVNQLLSTFNWLLIGWLPKKKEDISSLSLISNEIVAFSSFYLFYAWFKFRNVINVQHIKCTKIYRVDKPTERKLNGNNRSASEVELIIWISKFMLQKWTQIDSYGKQKPNTFRYLRRDCSFDWFLCNNFLLLRCFQSNFKFRNNIELKEKKM